MSTILPSGNETVEAKDALLTRLIQLTNRVPFDDRRALGATLDDVREPRVREFLRDVGSTLSNHTDDRRSYESVSEPTKVYLYPNRLEIISYPGPVDGIEEEHLSREQPLPPVPARNRRIGEFLKDLRLAEGRGTGLPKIYRSMSDNGSPAPRFDFDKGRSYFRVVLPAHPEFVALSALRDAAYLKTTGDGQGVLRRLSGALKSSPDSAPVASTLIRELAALGNIDACRAVHDAFPADSPGYAGVAAAMADAYLDAGNSDAAKKILDRMPKVLRSQEAFDAAILERRAGRQKQEHGLFLSAGDAVLSDARAAHEFAQTKIKLAGEARRRARGADRQARLRLLREAEELLQRVIQMDAPPTRHGWAWFDLGRVRRWLRKPGDDVRHAFEKAIEYCPDEPRFLEELKRIRGQEQP